MITVQDGSIENLVYRTFSPFKISPAKKCRMALESFKNIRRLEKNEVTKKHKIVLIRTLPHQKKCSVLMKFQT